MLKGWIVVCCVYAVAQAQSQFLSRRQLAQYMSRQRSPSQSTDAGQTPHAHQPRDLGVADSHDAVDLNSDTVSERIERYRLQSLSPSAGRDLNYQSSTRTGSQAQELGRAINRQPPQEVTIAARPPVQIYVDEDDRLLWENPPPEIPRHAFALEHTHPSKLQPQGASTDTAARASRRG